MPNWKEQIIAEAFAGTNGATQAPVDTTVPAHLVGVGSPNNKVAAAVGSVFVRTDGGSSTTLYVKETGGSTSAGWVAK